MKLLAVMMAYLSTIFGVAYFKLRAMKKRKLKTHDEWYIKDSYNTSVGVLWDKYENIKKGW